MELHSHAKNHKKLSNCSGDIQFSEIQPFLAKKRAKNGLIFINWQKQLLYSDSPPSKLVCMTIFNFLALFSKIQPF